MSLEGFKKPLSSKWFLHRATIAKTPLTYRNDEVSEGRKHFEINSDGRRLVKQQCSRYLN